MEKSKSLYLVTNLSGRKLHVWATSGAKAYAARAAAAGVTNA